MSSNEPSPRNMKISSYAKSVVVVLILVAGIFSAVLMPDTNIGLPVFERVIYIPKLVVLIPLLLVVEVVALLNKFIVKPPLQQRIAKAVAWSVAILGLMILPYVLLMTCEKPLERLAFVSAKSYVAHALPTLDVIKARNGYYPKTLPESELGTIPQPLSYWSDGTRYQFLYFDEDGVGIYLFESGDRTWHYEAGGCF